VRAFTKRYDKGKGGSIYPENGCLRLSIVVLAWAEWAAGTLDRGDNVIRFLYMILVKTMDSLPFPFGFQEECCTIIINQ